MFQVKELVSDFLKEKDVEKLIAKLEKSTCEEKQRVAYFLGDSKNVDVIPILIYLLKDKNKEVKQAAQNSVDIISKLKYIHIMNQLNILNAMLVGICPCNKLPAELSRISGQNFFRRSRRRITDYRI